jgi:magnesium transporter
MAEQAPPTIPPSPDTSTVLPPVPPADEVQIEHTAPDLGQLARQVSEWLSKGELEQIKAMVAELEAVDFADLLELSTPNDRQILIGLLQDEITPEVLSSLEMEVREDVLERLPAHVIAEAVAELDSDDAIDILEDLDDEQRADVLASLPSEDRADAQEALSYPEESAARLMQREVVAVPEEWTVGKTIDHMRDLSEELPDQFYDVIVVDPWHKVVGTLPLYTLMRTTRGVKLREIMSTDMHLINASMDREEAAHILKRYRLQSAAVVREDGYLLGALTFDDVSDILEEETEEDIRRMGGVGVEESIHDDVMEVTRSRFSWLFVNLLTAIMASLAIGMFEATLQQVVALAVLMPIVASMGGNAGTQTLTVAVRALAKKELGPSNYWGLVLREVRIGAVNGVGFAIIMGLVAWFWFEDVGIGLVIALAMVINLIAAGFSGALIPIAMRRFGIDPAVASAVFLTTITDVIGFVAFLGLATIFLF